MQVCHSEIEARQRWCPFARGIGKEQGGNRMPYDAPGDDPVNEDEARVDYAVEMATLYPCIASDCMAWRWAKTHVLGPMRPDGSANFVPSNDTHGYCGLAGPQT